eukprot:TRINITY_DN5644_c0_g1_i1.p1 TRINITY_DN5644_c0_g1~~TRINITY_DN5644_c0_g1_i1.p1  ORF type:complete len:417 (+),score=70.41 TRINITY_DN5644_c0_g1_i1:201-1451(+)
MQYLKSITHPTEFVALLKLYYQRSGSITLLPAQASDNIKWCYEMLNKTSRSFAFVIQELGPELRDAVCVFYLVLRGLDTVEDDTSVSASIRVPLLKSFYEKLYLPGWNTSECGVGDEKILLANFHKVIEVFLSLPREVQVIIEDITRRMGVGMAEFISHKEVVSIKDWDLYCFYVAGLVGLGLSRLFAATRTEDPWFATADELSTSMGLLLQKTNIIRDYLEDINEKRIFWPREVWQKYAANLETFKDPNFSREAVSCLNDLITNALTHVPDCLDYMSKLTDKRNFNFCAIPQVMAIATLALCYDNHGVFTGVVKIRRGQSAKIILDINNYGIQALYSHFLEGLEEISSKIRPEDPSAEKTRAIVNKVIAMVRPHVEAHLATQQAFGVGDVVAVAALVSSSAYLVQRHKGKIFAKL